MSDKKEILVDKFLENNNMDYLFCILAGKESERLNILPDSIKKVFDEKITTMSLKHIAMNNVPDYIIEEVIENQEVIDDDTDWYVDEEIEDDSLTKTGGFESINLDEYDEEHVIEEE
jgi:hypothetical protein